MDDTNDLLSVDLSNGDLHSTKYVRLNDGSRRRSSALTGEQDSSSRKKSSSGAQQLNGKSRSSASSVPQDAHLRHYQEHLEERRLKNRRLREGKLVTMLRKKTATVTKKDASTQVTPADLGLDDWDDEDEEEEEEDEVVNMIDDYADIYGAYPRPSSAAPDPGPWQDVSGSQDSYQQWYNQQWSEQETGGGEGASPQLTQEQTYRYVYYYYNYYAAMETQDTGGDGAGADPNLEHYSDPTMTQPQQQYLDPNVGGWLGANADEHGGSKNPSGHKRHMRGLFDEWRRKYEGWYKSTFGKSVTDNHQAPESTAMAAHRAQMETARLTALKQQQELHLERPGRPDSLLPAPPFGQDPAAESLLPRPPSVPPPETPAPPPPPETPRPETPAAQAAAAAAAAHLLGANVSTPADVATAIAQLSNSDLSAILASVNRAAARSATPVAIPPTPPASSTSTFNLLAAAAPSLLSLPPLPVIGIPNPLAAPMFPPPMPVTLRREALAAASAMTPASSISLVQASPMIVLPSALSAIASASAVKPPTAAQTIATSPSSTSSASSLPSVPQMMMMQPSFKFGPPFKPFGVFQGGTEDKWGPDAPLGRYGQRKEEEEKEAKSRLEARRRHLSDPGKPDEKESSPAPADAEDDRGSSPGELEERPDSPEARLSPEPASPMATEDSETAADGVASSENEAGKSREQENEASKSREQENEASKSREQENGKEEEAEVAAEPSKEVEETAKSLEPPMNGKEESEEDAGSAKDDDSDSVSSGGSVCSTATQSVAIGPRRTRMASSICGGAAERRPARLAFPPSASASSIPVEKLTSLAESAAKRAVSDGIWYAPSQPLNSLRLPKQAMLHTLQSHMRPKIAELLSREKDPRLQLTLSYAKFLMDGVRNLLDISVQFVVGSLCRLPSQLAKDFYSWDQLSAEVANSMKLCDVYIGDVFIAQGAAATTLGAKEAASRQAFKVLSRPGYVLGSTRLWMDADHLVLCVSEFPLTVPILPPFLLDPCSPTILHGPQPPSEFGPPGPDGDGGLETEVGGEVEDEEDWLLQSVAINPKPLENLWLYDSYDEVAVAASLRQVAERREWRMARRVEQRQRQEEAGPSEPEAEREAPRARRPSRRVSGRWQQSSGGPASEDLHEAALADMSTLTLGPQLDGAEAEEDAVAGDEPDLSGVEIDAEALAILGRSCDFSHMLLSVEIEVNRDASFTCSVFIDRQFCACATDQPAPQIARQLAATRALALLRLSQPAVGLDAPELSPAAVVDSLMWRARYETVRPVHSLLSSYGMSHFEWDRIFMFYAESASIEAFFISKEELEAAKWTEVKKEAEKWGLLVKECRIPGMSSDVPEEESLCLFVCKRMPLTTVKRRLMRYGQCGHFLLLRRGVYPTSEDEEQSGDDGSVEEEEEEDPYGASGGGEEPKGPAEPIVTMAEVKEEPGEEEETLFEDLTFLGGSSTANDCEILDDLPKTRIPGFDY